ncbi:MAG: T9SS type A sorting domain-containing protein, partial [Melioribacteraceae bacterium]|nr:T9SS type A sorting domain-containing protein [Melioribacteraceae bacterium]
EFGLSQNYPNPFNPTTTIRVALPKESHVVLNIYNILGEKVKTLANELMPAGYSNFTFDASNLNSGMYIYRVEAGDFVEVKKMILLK